MGSLEDRYKTHEIPKSIKQLFISEDAVGVYLTENNLRLVKLQSKNKRQLLYNKILQLIFWFDKEALNIDRGYLKENDQLFSSTIDMLTSLYSVLDEKNYLEIGKLIDFILELYADNYGVISSKRRALNYNRSGIQFFDNRYSDTREDVEEFFNKETQKYKKDKMLEKKA